MSKQNLKLWIVNHHAAIPSKDGRSGRHLAFGRHLKALGWDTTLIVSSTAHPSGAQILRGRSLTATTEEEGVPVRWLRTTAYGNSTPLRFLGMVIFAIMALMPRSTRDLPKPDVVIGSTVHPFAAWAGWRLSRRHRVPFVYEIRDVWPDVLVQLGKLKPHGLLARLIRHISQVLAKRASLVISPLPRVDDYLASVGAGDIPFLWVSNGVEPAAPTGPQPTWVNVEDDFTFMYFGSFNQSNMVEGIIDAFAEAAVQEPGRRWRLRMVGDGPLKDALKSRATAGDDAGQISIEDPVPRTEIIALAQRADCLVAMLHGYDVYSYGISLNKLFDYLLAGRPVIFATNAPNNPVAEAGAGMVVAPGDQEAFSNAMIDVAKMSEEERKAMGARGREHVLENYTYDVLTAKLAAGLEAIVSDSEGVLRSRG